MKRRTSIFAVVALLVCILAGCGNKNTQPSLEIMPNDDNTISITANKAGKSGGGGADITVSEGQKLVIDSTLSKGEIQIKFFREEEPASADDALEGILHTNDDTTLDVTVNAAGTTEHDVAPGVYTIMVIVQKTATGTITISTK